MSLLEIIVIFSSVVIGFFAVDAYKRQKMNFLHFMAFFGGAGMVFVFAFYPSALDKFGQFFGVARGADLLVYIVLIVLSYMFFQLLHKLTKQKIAISKMVSNRAIKDGLDQINFNDFSKHSEYDDFVFLIRAYNEDSKIAEVLDSVLEKGFNKIVVVDDGSSDCTFDIVQKYKEKNNNIVLLSHDINRGPGAANKTGFEFISKYFKDLGVSWVVTFDADDQMDVEDMDLFIKRIKNNSNTPVFLGSRFIKGASTDNMPISRKLAFRTLARWFTKLLNGIWVSDPHNGYRVLDIKFVQNLKIESDGMSYASELIDNIKRLEVDFVEVPVHIKYTDYSLSKGQKLTNAISIVTETVYKKFFYR